MTQKIYFKGTNEVYKKPIVFSVEGKEEGESLIFGFPFQNTKLHKDKFKDNSEDKPFNYIISMRTYENAINKENPFNEFIKEIEKLSNEFKEMDKFRFEDKGDYTSFDFTPKDNKHLNYFRISLNRRTITKANIEFQNAYTMNRDKKEITKDDLEFFKEWLQQKKTIILNSIKEASQVNPIFEDIKEYVKQFERKKVDCFDFSLRLCENLEKISLYFRVEYYLIPKRFNDSISRSKSYSLDISKDGEVTESEHTTSEKLENKTIEGVKELLKSVYESLKDYKITKQEAEQEKERLYKIYQEENCLTEEKLKKIGEEFKIGDKVTIKGVANWLGSLTETEGRVARINEREIAVFGKGCKKRGVIIKVGDNFKEIVRGYKK